MTYGVQRSFEDTLPTAPNAGKTILIVDRWGATLLKYDEDGGAEVGFVDRLSTMLPEGQYLLVPRDKIQEATDRGW